MCRHTSLITHVAVSLLVMMPSLALAESQQQQEMSPLRVAVFDFDTGTIPVEGMGTLIGQVVTIVLSGHSGLEMVDRASLDKVLQEQALTLSGLVDTSQAIEIGQLVGAEILIVGRAFQLGDRLLITAKIIGTPTSRVDGVLIRQEDDMQVDQMVMALADQLGHRVVEVGARLAARDKAVDPLPGLLAALSQRQDLPTVAVMVREEHRRPRPAQTPAPDPAVETEIKRLLLAAGVTIQDVPANALATWVREHRMGRPAPWPQGLEHVDLIITGEGFSEAAGRLDRMHSAAARVEINVIDRSTGQIVVAERITTRAVDLAEEIAGKSALQKAGHAMGLAVLQYLIEDNAVEPQ